MVDCGLVKEPEMLNNVSCNPDCVFRVESAPRKVDGKWAVGRDARAYVSDYKRPQADFYRVNTSTGERTLMFKGQLTGQNAFGISPDGRSIFPL